jgi:hypothetical protein
VNGWIVALLIAGRASAQEADVVDAAPAPHWSFAALPTFNFSSDTGVGFGARGKAQRLANGVEPYWLSLEAQLYGTTLGAQMHFLSADIPSVAGSQWRLDALAGFKRDVAAHFYGAERADETDPSTLYTDTAGIVRVRAQRPLWSHLALRMGYRFFYTDIDVRQGSRLEQARPFGIAGGPYSELSLGLTWDTRDDELVPTRGVLIEAAVRGAAKFLGSAGNSAGVYAAASGYQPLMPGWLLAARIAVDATFGDVPFNRAGDLGTMTSPNFITAGIGGSTTVRGLLQSEYVGARKLITNVELRFPIYAFTFFKQNLAFSGVAFVDAGHVDPGPVRLGAGGGLRIRWGKFFIVRLDAGYAGDGVRFYADFGHAF